MNPQLRSNNHTKSAFADYKRLRMRDSKARTLAEWHRYHGAP
jgi:hypothetical protein